MPTPIADALVLAFTYGVSLRQWQDSGMLSREWALYQAILPHYRKLILVTYGRSDDQEVLDSILTQANRPKVALICNSHGLAPGKYVAGLPQRLAEQTA